MAKERLLSGMQPTQPMLHLGNLEGALRNWVRLQDRYEMYCCIVDWHSLTTMAEDSSEIAANCRGIAMDYLAAGMDPERTAIFIQSHVKEHAELALLLGMVTPLSWLERVPTYKEKRENLQIESVPFGLLGYPVLQAADILMYKPYGVPVGKDQLPHLELTREIARRFNHLYGPVFPEPESITGEVELMMGTDGRKMSKSYENAIYIADSEEETAGKIKSAFTDPEKIRKNDPGHPEGCAVFSLHTVYSKPNVQVVEHECRNGLRGCVACKQECIANVNGSLKSVREGRAALERDPDQVERILTGGAEKAREFAAATMVEVRRAMHIR
jgi:tryptophanyl-tRNA synthetase